MNINAALGPTNTGKTFYAIERMTSYQSGIIGLPLRLLTKEVFDKITKQRSDARKKLLDKVNPILESYVNENNIFSNCMCRKSTE